MLGLRTNTTKEKKTFHSDPAKPLKITWAVSIFNDPFWIRIRISSFPAALIFRIQMLLHFNIILDRWALFTNQTAGMATRSNDQRFWRYPIKENYDPDPNRIQFDWLSGSVSRIEASQQWPPKKRNFNHWRVLCRARGFSWSLNVLCGV